MKVKGYKTNRCIWETRLWKSKKKKKNTIGIENKTETMKNIENLKNISIHLENNISETENNMITIEEKFFEY